METIIVLMSLVTMVAVHSLVENRMNQILNGTARTWKKTILTSANLLVGFLCLAVYMLLTG